MTCVITKDTPVYYINLDDNIDRNNNIKETLARHGFTNINRISAVDTRTIQKVNQYKKFINQQAYDTLLEDIQNKKRKFHESLTTGAVGCYLSHYEIYQQISQLDDGHDCALIFEDDVIIDIPTTLFWERIHDLKIPDDIDIYLLNGHYYNQGYAIDKLSLKVERFIGLYGYIVTKKGSKILCDRLLPIKYQLDHALSILRSAHLINIYGYIGKPIIKHDYGMFKSTIQNLKCKDCDLKNLTEEAKVIPLKGYSRSRPVIERFNGYVENSNYFNINNIIIFVIIIILCLFIILHKNILWILIIILVLLMGIIIVNLRNAKEGFSSESYDMNHDIFDDIGIYVINLKSRPFKKQYMIDELKKANVDGEIIEAVDGSSLDVDQIHHLLKSKEKLRRGEIGCYFSHFNVWNKFLKSNKEYALILEDDAILPYDFKHKVNMYFDELKPFDWDVFYLTMNCKGHPNFEKKCDKWRNLTESVKIPDVIGYGLYGYIINRNAAQIFIENALPIKFPVDVYLADNQINNKKLKFVQLKNPIILLNTSKDFVSDTVGII